MIVELSRINVIYEYKLNIRSELIPVSSTTIGFILETLSLSVLYFYRGFFITKFEYKGYLYNKDIDIEDGNTMWQCDQRECSVTVISDPNGVIVREPAAHSHPADPERVRKVQRKRAKIETASGSVRNARDKWFKRLVKNKYQTLRKNKAAINYHLRKLLAQLAGNPNGVATTAATVTAEPATSSIALSTSESSNAEAPLPHTFGGLEEMRIGGAAASSSNAPFPHDVSILNPLEQIPLGGIGQSKTSNPNSLEILAQASLLPQMKEPRMPASSVQLPLNLHGFTFQSNP